jgi:hypothetical protein
MFDLSNLGSLGDLAKQMEDAYSMGTDVMNQAGEQVAEDMNPDHEIKVDIKLDAKIEGHIYSVDAGITFKIELEPVLQAADSPMGDLSSLLDGLDVDLGDDKGAVMEQLGQPRAVGIVKKIKTNKLEVSDKKGKAKVELNRKATLLATIKDEKILFNFEGVFSYPNNPSVFIAIPSMEKMQKHIVVDLKNISQKVEFNWTEKDKDNLKVFGTLLINKL